MKIPTHLICFHFRILKNKVCTVTVYERWRNSMSDLELIKGAPHLWAMGCLLWGMWRKLIMLCSPRLYLINLLKPGDAIWWLRYVSTLAEVMSCCLRAPSHFLNWCWRIISKVQGNLSGVNFTRATSAINYYNLLESCNSNLPGANESMKKSYSGLSTFVALYSGSTGSWKRKPVHYLLKLDIWYSSLALFWHHYRIYLN